MRILVGVDGSDHAKMALVEAIQIAKQFSGFIKVLTVHKQGRETHATNILKEAEQLVKKQKLPYDLSSVLGTNPSRALVNMATHENFDLIVVGSRGLSSTASILLGGVSRQVVTNAQCDVLVVKK